MKTMKLMMLFVVCVATAACGGENLDAYKRKLLEGIAKEGETTVELLVKDFDITVDSMSVLPFLLQDSIEYVKYNYEKQKKPLDESISYEKERIETLSKKLEKEKKGDSYSFIALLKNNIFDARIKLENAEKKLESLTKHFETDMSKFEGRNPNDAIYNMFCYRFTAKNPFTGGHQVTYEIAFFSLDGEHLLTDVCGELLNFMKNRTKEK